MGAGSRGAAERSDEPVEALELKMPYDDPNFINVRFAGYRFCSPADASPNGNRPDGHGAAAAFVTPQRIAGLHASKSTRPDLRQSAVFPDPTSTDPTPAESPSLRTTGLDGSTSGTPHPKRNTAANGVRSHDEGLCCTPIAVERGDEPDGALELKILHDEHSFINVRPAGDPHC
jgi:hypothetical protein